MNGKTKLIVCLVSILFYTLLLALCGSFGVALQSMVITVFKTVLPILSILFGYFLCIFVPFRVSKALRRNKEKEEQLKADLRLEELANQAKLHKHQILKTIEEGEEL